MYLAGYARRPEKLCVGTETGKSLSNFLAYRDHDFAIGQFIWVGWDYLGEARRPPQRGWQGGLFDVSGNPRPDLLRYETYWSDEPVIHITVKDTSGRQEKSSWNRTMNDSVFVHVYTNCGEVELSLNGRSHGRKKVNPDLYLAAWDLLHQKGEIRATGFLDGSPVAETALHSTGDPVRIVARPVWKEMKADRQDISIIELSLVDRSGHVVPEADDPIRVNVRGNARLIGIDSGDLFYEGSFKASWRRATRGRMNVLLQAEDEPGEVVVTFTSGKLKPATVTLVSTHPGG
jgi:hypothetical protein